MRYYVYILQSAKDGRFYIGQTQDLSVRLAQHNRGYSKYTSKYKPWNLVWYIIFESRKEAFGYELKLKRLKSRLRLITTMKENPCVPGSENIQICDLIDFRESP